MWRVPIAVYSEQQVENGLKGARRASCKTEHTTDHEQETEKAHQSTENKGSSNYRITRQLATNAGQTKPFA